jgi:hypothetical protein
LDAGEEEAATDRVARIWEEFDSVLSMTIMPGRTTLHLLQQQPWDQHVHMERT